MNKKLVFLIGLIGITLILSLVFGCGDLGEEIETTNPISNVAATPVVTLSPAAGLYAQNADAVALTVSVTVSAGNLSPVKWYKNDTSSTSGGEEITEAAGQASYTPPTADIGNTYYYIEVTNTDESKETPTATGTSNVAWIRVIDTSTLAPSTVMVNTGTRYQWVRGFGGMMNAWTSPPMSNEDIDTTFSQEGLGLNIFRVMIYPYMDDLFNGNEAGPASEPDIHLYYYNRIRRAKSHGAAILASPWTMPAEWKTNGTRLTGFLLPGNWADYAQHLKSYITRMATNNAAIDFISIQNEPDIGVSYDGCEWTPEDNRDFIKQYGRYIAPADGPVKIMPGESYQFRDVFFGPMYDDADAMASIDIVAGHIYGGGLRRHPRPINAGKEVWMTEHLYNTGSNYWLDPQWQSVWLVANEFHDLMVYDFTAIVWWYIKRYYNLIGDGEYGTIDGAPLFRGYAVSHYAKYATNKTRVDAKSVGSTNVTARTTAYESDSEITLVLVNQGAAINNLNIVLPVAATSASLVVTKGDSPSDNDPTGKAMVPGTINLSEDKMTGIFDVPASSIVSVRFTK